jgi:hypothetical protein
MKRILLILTCIIPLSIFAQAILQPEGGNGGNGGADRSPTNADIPKGIKIWENRITKKIYHINNLGTGWDSTSFSGVLTWNANATTIFPFDFNKNVSVGTSNNVSKFHVNGTTAIGLNYTESGASVGSIVPNVLNLSSSSVLSTTGTLAPEYVLAGSTIGVTGTTFNNSWGLLTSKYVAGLNAATGLHLRLGLGASNLPNMDVMTWLANGRVGINTTNPLFGIHYQKGTSSYLPASGDGLIISTNAAGGAVIILDHNNGTAFGRVMKIETANALTQFGSAADNGGSFIKPGILTLQHLTGNVGIGTTTGSSTLSVNGSISTVIIQTSLAAYTADKENTIRLTLPGAQALTLPAPNTAVGRIYNIVNATSFAKTISSYINMSSLPTTTIAANESFSVHSDGSNWIRFTISPNTIALTAPTSTGATAYTALLIDNTITLTLLGTQTLTLPTGAAYIGKKYTISNPTGYLKYFATAVTGVDNINTTKILKNCVVEYDGTTWRMTQGVKSYTDTKFFAAATFTTGSLIVGGVEFSMVGAVTIGATTFLQARVVGTTPATRIMTGLLSRQTFAAVPVFAHEAINPSFTTAYTALNTATTAFNSNYIKNEYELNDRLTGEKWTATLTTDGSINAMLTVNYTTPN